MKCGAMVSGFTMIEMLLAILGISIFVPMLASGTKLLMFDQSVEVSQMEDMMGIEQLRLYLAQGNISYDNSSCLSYTTDAEYNLLLVNGNLTLRPGNLVFLTSIDSICFYEELTSICMKYKKNGKWFDVWLGYPQRVY